VLPVLPVPNHRLVQVQATTPRPKPMIDVQVRLVATEKGRKGKERKGSEAKQSKQRNLSELRESENKYQMKKKLWRQDSVMFIHIAERPTGTVV